MTAMNPDVPPTVNHIFVDFENVQEIDPAVSGRTSVRFTLLAGPRNTKLDITVVKGLLSHPDAAQLIQLNASGKNALDFALAYYVGRAVIGDPTGRFHIVSKDKGFDPLVEHLRFKNIQAFRHDSFVALDLARSAKVKASPAVPSRSKKKPKAMVKVSTSRLDELAAKTLDHLRQATTKPPKSLQKLVSHLGTHLGKKITASEVPGLVDSLRSEGYLTIDEKGVVTYQLESR